MLNSEASVHQKFSSSLNAWDLNSSLSPDGTSGVSAVSEVQVEETWTLPVGKQPYYRKVQPLNITADPSKFEPRIDPTAAPSSPFLKLRLELPQSLAYYVGLPAYVSIHLFVSVDSGSVDEYLELPVNPKDLLVDYQIDVGTFLTKAMAVAGTYVRLGRQSAVLKFVTFGVLAWQSAHAVLNPHADISCKTRIVRGGSKGKWPNSEVSYYAVLACGVTRLTTTTRPAVQRPPVAREACRAIPTGDWELI